jgi:hypothetical protein
VLQRLDETGDGGRSGKGAVAAANCLNCWRVPSPFGVGERRTSDVHDDWRGREPLEGVCDCGDGLDDLGGRRLRIALDPDSELLSLLRCRDRRDDLTRPLSYAAAAAYGGLQGPWVDSIVRESHSPRRICLRLSVCIFCFVVVAGSVCVRDLHSAL